MAQFGVGVRGKTASFGKMATQSVAIPRVSGSSVDDGLVTARTASPSLFSRAVIENLKLPSVARFIPPLILKPPTKYEQDTLRVSQFRIENSTFQPVEKNGISVFRPEIISMMEFKPIDGRGDLKSKDSVESAEQLLKAQYQATEVRAVTIQRLMNDMRANTKFKANLETLRTKYTTGLQSTKTALEYLSDLVTKVDNVKTSLDPKKIPVGAYDTNKYLPLIDLFDKKMQYSKMKFANFSDTKILNQMISDLGHILEGHSLSLLDLSDGDRPTDFSPINIDKTYTQASGFTFDISSIRSETIAENANKPTFFVPFLNSLPLNPDDRIKLLVNILSKELRVSRQMGKAETQRVLSEKFSQTDTGNPFNNIIGTVGNNIFEPSLGPNSLASLTSFDIDGNITVLPFESVYVDSEDERKTYVPGSTYFADTILDVTEETGFNIQPYVAFANRFNTVVSTTKSTVNTLLENTDSKLAQDNLYDTYLSSLVESISGTGSVTSINRSQALMLALFRLANTDTILKNQLFEYLLLLGLTSINNTDQKKIFERLAREIGSIHNFTYVKAATNENPNLFNGLATLKPYLESLAGDIEAKVFSLIYGDILSLGPTIPRFIPSRPIGETTPLVTSPLSRLAGSVGSGILTATNIGTALNLSRFFIVFTKGELKEILLNNATTTGGVTSNLCKEFIDLAVKFDQLSAIGANAVHFVPDGTGRTRFNFLSVSTQMLLIFETLSSLVNRYCFADFNKEGNTSTQASMIMDSSLMSGIARIIKTIIVTRPNFNIDTLVTNPRTGFAADALTRTSTTPSSPYSLFSTDSARASLRLPFASSRQAIGNTSTVSLSPSLNLEVLTNSPALGFGRLVDDLSLPIELLPDALKLLGYRKTLVSNRTKLMDENLVVENIFHVFDILNQRLLNSKEEVVNTFTRTSLRNIFATTNITIEDVKLTRTPSQIRTSAWLLERFNERIANPGTLEETWDSNNGFLVTDRIPFAQFNALMAMLNQPKYQYKSLADFKTKILSVGIPAGFSRNLSDRVSRTSISSTNFKDKQFDVIAINVYKRDARYDDLVFKPQRFFFDLSLFPIRNFLSAAALSLLPNYFQILREASMMDYESLQDKRTVTLASIQDNEKYSFLSSFQKQQMMQNHVESQLLALYIRLMAGMRIDEETFTETLYDKLGEQDQQVYNLITSFLKTVKNKTIPNLPVEQLLVSPLVDQESKDTIRLLSYGNIVFQSEFVKRRILDAKLFDRVFNLPINIDDFPIDVEATISTESGRSTYMKNSIQDQLVRVGTNEYLKPRERNDLVFEDYFVVVESNLRGGA